MYVEIFRWKCTDVYKLPCLVQFRHSVMSNSLWPHGLQHPVFPVHHQFPELAQTRTSSRWCHLTTSSSVSPSPASIFPSIRVFSDESVLRLRWLKNWSVSLSISLSSDIQGWFPLGLAGWISLQLKGLSRVFFNTTVQKHQFFSAQFSLWSNSHIHTWLVEKP